MRIGGTRVLLTGASGGIGQAIARDLAARGAKLLLSGRQADVLSDLAAEIDGEVLVADLAKPGEAERLAEAAGAVDILLANAGLPGTGRLEGYAIEQIDRVLEVNLRSPILLARLLLPQMQTRGGGHLLFVSSLSGKAAAPNSSLYNATKFGLRGFAHALRAELRGSGVGVSLVCPGFIRDAGMFAKSNTQLPKGVGTRTPQDVAGAVADAIESNKAEVDVAPLPLRVGAATWGLAPGLSARIARAAGGDRVAAELADGQSSFR